jgi:hypothetical protein
MTVRFKNGVETHDPVEIQEFADNACLNKAVQGFIDSSERNGGIG